MEQDTGEKGPKGSDTNFLALGINSPHCRLRTEGSSLWILEEYPQTTTLGYPVPQPLKWSVLRSAEHHKEEDGRLNFFYFNLTRLRDVLRAG